MLEGPSNTLKVSLGLYIAYLVTLTGADAFPEPHTLDNAGVTYSVLLLTILTWLLGMSVSFNFCAIQGTNHWNRSRKSSSRRLGARLLRRLYLCRTPAWLAYAQRQVKWIRQEDRGRLAQEAATRQDRRH